jgi:hypothetical protein
MPGVAYRFAHWEGWEKRRRIPIAPTTPATQPRSGGRTKPTAQAVGNGNDDERILPLCRRPFTSASA